LDIALQIVLPPADVAELVRLRGLTQQRAGRWQSGALTIVWYDTATGELRSANQVLSEQRRAQSPRGRLSGPLWRLETLRSNPQTCLPGAVPPVIAEAIEPHEMVALPEKLVAFAAFSGKWRLLNLRTDDGPGQAVCLTMIDGEIRTIAATQPVCRLTLTGAPDAVLSVATYLCDHLNVSVPMQSLAIEGQVLSGITQANPPAGSPNLPAGGSSEDGFVRLLGELAASLYFWAPLTAGARDPNGKGEPVHQMRVVVRRLRSALTLFRSIVDCREIQAIKVGLKQLGTCLGPARDWDVFLMGTGRAVSCAFPDEAALAGLMRAGEVRRERHYMTLRHYLKGVEFRRLCVMLAWVAQARPWHGVAEEVCTPELTDFAIRVLRQRRRRLLAAGTDISDMPDPALHALRLRGKQLRYACEFFLPLFPGKSTKRFIRDLADLQEELGLLNDRAVATSLLGEISGAGREQSRAHGIVIGYIAAGRSRERRRLVAVWKKMQRSKDLTK
jgi:CHAD domain-containing protein